MKIKIKLKKKKNKKKKKKKIFSTYSCSLETYLLVQSKYYLCIFSFINSII